VSWRLICETCTKRLREEIKSVGIITHPDLRCACCGVRIRASNEETHTSGGKWSPVSEDQLMRVRFKSENDPDDQLHYSFALDENQAALGVAQDEICRAKTLKHVVPCKVFKCDEMDLGVHVVQIYMNDHTPNPIYAGAVWRYDRWPSDIEIMFALKRWRGPGAPEFTVEWYAASEKEEGS
jgi:hypothetical protein